MTMPGELCIIQTIPREGPGVIRPMAEQRGWRVSLTRLWTADALPQPGSGQAFLLLGGPASANDCHGRIPELLDLSGALLKQQRPVMGICLGLQLLAKAAGSTIGPADRKELGWLDPSGVPWQLVCTREASGHPLFQGLPDRLPVFQLHGETVLQADPCAVLATSPWCRHQILALGVAAYGIQGHLEGELAMIKQWFTEDPDLASIRSQQPLTDGLLPEVQHCGQRFFGNWLDLAARQLG